MNKDVADKITAANERMGEVSRSLRVYLDSLGNARRAFEELASSCAAVISQPFIEVDTRDIDG
jgi:hypothetical protein